MLKSSTTKLGCYTKHLDHWITLNLYMCPKSTKEFGKSSKNPGTTPHVESQPEGSEELRTDFSPGGQFLVFSDSFHSFQDILTCYI